MAAIGTCMHKVLRIVYGMLKNKEEFNPQKDRALREKSFAKEIKPADSNKNRRYQPIDSNAPISRRQAKRRKEIISADNLSSDKNKKEEAGNVP